MFGFGGSVSIEMLEKVEFVSGSHCWFSGFKEYRSRLLWGGT